MADLFLQASAEFPAQAYRTLLSRWWDDGPRLCVCGQNPSLADRDRSDPTITRCVRRARDLGFAGLDMVNLYPLVTPYPDLMFAVPDALGVEYGIDADAVILDAARKAGMVIAAWGGDRRQAERATHVRRMLNQHGIPLYALGFTLDGAPRHPSRLAYSVQPEVWGAA